MHMVQNRGRILNLFLAALMLSGIVPNHSLADEKESNRTPAKPVPVKIDSPAPLTERERWMLDRMEQLEKRVAELEAKSSSAVGNSATATARETGSAQPTSASAAKALRSLPDVLSPEAAVTEMKTQEKAGKPEKAEPFAFADFT